MDSRYEPGQRSGAWQKMRIDQGQEFVIGGYTVGGRTDGDENATSTTVMTDVVLSAGAGDLSNEDVVKTMKAICEHQVHRAAA